MQQDTEQQDIDELKIDQVRVLQIFLQTAKRLWLPMLLVIAFFVAAVVFVQQKSYVPSYKAYCTFSVHVMNKATLSDTNSRYAVYYNQDLAEQLDATFSYLINSDFLTDDIQEYLGANTVDGSIQANSIEGSNIFILSTYSSSPEKAAALLEAVMAVYYDAARYVVGDMKTEIIEGPVASQVPHNAPNRMNWVLRGIAIGLMLNIGVIALYALFKRTVIEPSDLENHLNVQCLGMLPLLQAKKNLIDNPTKVSTTHEMGMFRESVRGIARKLEIAMGTLDKKVLLITSTAPGEGKSTLSQNLAEIFAHWDKSVVLLDGDLRNPTLYRRYGSKQDKFSLEAVLRGNAPVDTVLHRRQSDGLTVVLNSVPVENPTVFIDSPAMKEMISAFAAQADIVIIDTPPCGQFSDVSLYQQYADGILFVVQQDRVTITQIVDVAESLCRPANKLLGYVLNGVQQIPRGYGKYGYGKYGYSKYGYSKYGYSKYGYDKYSYGEHSGQGDTYRKYEAPGESNQQNNVWER